MWYKESPAAVISWQIKGNCPREKHLKNHLAIFLVYSAISEMTSTNRPLISDLKASRLNPEMSRDVRYSRSLYKSWFHVANKCLPLFWEIRFVPSRWHRGARDQVCDEAAVSRLETWWMVSKPSFTKIQSLNTALGNVTVFNLVELFSVNLV